MATAVLAMVLLVAAEPAAPPGHDARITMVRSPEIEGGLVTFRLRAPRAKEALVTGVGLEPLALVRDADGIWSGRAGPLAPGIHSYGLRVDGLQIPDPANAWIKPGRVLNASVFEIPGGRADHLDRGAPRGSVVVREYRWRGQARRLHAYTPPGHERGAGGPLPVVYLLHGFSDTDATWSAFGRAHVILDNLIADRRAPPVVLVMPDGQPIEPRSGQASREYLLANADALAAELREEVVPLVERAFRVARGRAGRAVIGFAMGAHQALVAAPDFRGIAAIGPPIVPVGIARRPGDRLFFRLPPGHPELVTIESLVARLASQRIAASLAIRPETGFWAAWRQDLADLLPRLVAR